MKFRRGRVKKLFFVLAAILLWNILRISTMREERDGANAHDTLRRTFFRNNSTRKAMEVPSRKAKIGSFKRGAKSPTKIMPRKKENLVSDLQNQLSADALNLTSKIRAVGDNSNFVNNVQLKTSNTNKKYLFPILLGNQGPNNQLQSFKISAVIAAYRDRTLVLTPFFNHFTVNTFDQRHPNETIDVEVIKKLLPVATMEEYLQECNNRVDVLFSGVNVTNDVTKTYYNSVLSYVQALIEEFTKLSGVRIPNMYKEPEKVIQLPDHIPNGYTPFWKVSSMPGLFQSDSRCVGIAYPYGLLGRFYYHDYSPILSKYVLRPAMIRKLAQDVIKGYFKNKNFLGIHWRYNEEWKKQWCFMNSEHDRKACQALNSTSSEFVVRIVKNIMVAYNLSGVFLGTPLKPEDPLIRAFRHNIRNFVTSSIIIDDDFPGADDLEFDNYKISMFEQEICKHSTIFLASSRSSWSEIVGEERMQNTLLIPDVFTQFS
ncbi:uncharacterized protein LOC144445973 [Glandiceps talaboti]